MTATASSAGAALAALGTLVWLLALAGGEVGNPTVWAVVGIGVGIFLVGNALRLADGPLTISPRARSLLGGALVVAVLTATGLALWQGLGAGLLVLGGLAGIVLWVASSVAVAGGT